jgi:hypothetical protein
LSQPLNSGIPFLTQSSKAFVRNNLFHQFQMFILTIKGNEIYTLIISCAGLELKKFFWMKGFGNKRNYK